MGRCVAASGTHTLTCTVSDVIAVKMDINSLRSAVELWARKLKQKLEKVTYLPTPAVRYSCCAKNVRTTPPINSYHDACSAIIDSVTLEEKQGR
jgi:hypothetical protein